MASLSPEFINKLSALQPQIWQTVALTVNDAANLPLQFTDPLTLSTPTADLYGEMASPKLVVQFSFANLPENSQVILINPDTVTGLLRLVTDEPSANVDDNAVAELRPIIEGLVQGICLAVGNLRNDAFLASGMSIRFQIFSFPPNLQRADEVIRTNIAVTHPDVNGSAIWLMDAETAALILGMSVAEDDDGSKSLAGTSSSASHSSPTGSISEDTGLELLMDIPLEISVELGRVRMVVKDVVELGSGSIVEIDKAAGEPVDVMVNGRLVARGEVVVIEDNFGVRITEILSPQDRLAKLNEVA